MFILLPIIDMPIHRLLLLAALLLAAPAQAQRPASTEAWRTDVPCTAGRNPALVVSDSATAQRVPGCVRAHCVALRGGGRVCTCTRDTTIVVRVDDAGGVIVREWPADYQLASAPESLRAMQGDLDGDGKGETIVAERMAVSNGLGVAYHRLSIFDGRDLSRAPMRVNVEDFDADGSFVRPARGDCRLVATRWGELTDAQRGAGMYLIGQWMRYREGRLEHDPDRPVVVRRLLDSFANARGHTPNAPFAHLRHRDARAHAGHGIPPLPRHVRTEEGAFRRMRGDTVVVALEPNVVSGHTLGDFHREEDGWIFTAWLVDGATGRPYPPGYRPSDERWLDGVPVRQQTYVKDEERTVFVLTIRPRTPAQP